LAVGGGWTLPKPSVRSVGVVVADVFGEDGVQVPAADDDQAIEALASDSADPRPRARLTPLSATDGQVYWSGLHQLGVYVDGCHERLGASASEMITEVFLPRDRLIDFMAACRDDFRTHAVELVCGTIRAIRKDDETFLPWAHRDRACVVFNLHVRHDAAGIAKAGEDFRRIIGRSRRSARNRCASA
jgi:hypothetical protein